MKSILLITALFMSSMINAHGFYNNNGFYNNGYTTIFFEILITNFSNSTEEPST